MSWLMSYLRKTNYAILLLQSHFQEHLQLFAAAIVTKKCD